MDDVPRMQDLREVVPWGRAFAEYVRFFALTPAELSLRILDCGGGPASFAAEAFERGHAIVACDPLYRFSPVEIGTRVREVEPFMRQAMVAERARFVWTYAGSPEEVADRRLAAMQRSGGSIGRVEDWPLRGRGASEPALPRQRLRSGAVVALSLSLL
jgi:hypothetical protein